MANGEAYKKEIAELDRLANIGQLTSSHYYYKLLVNKQNVPAVKACFDRINPKLQG